MQNWRVEISVIGVGNARTLVFVRTIGTSYRSAVQWMFKHVRDVEAVLEIHAEKAPQIVIRNAAV